MSSKSIDLLITVIAESVARNIISDSGTCIDRKYSLIQYSEG